MTQISLRPRRVVAKLAELLASRGLPMHGAQIHVVGVAYKPGVADVRESPALQIITECLAAGADVAGPFSMSPIAGGAVGAAVKVTETNQSIEIDTGWLHCKINRSGSNLFESMTAQGVDCSGVLRAARYNTPTKVRILGGMPHARRR